MLYQKIINTKNVVHIIRKTLNMVDKRLVDHGERVAFLLHEMTQFDQSYDPLTRQTIVLLGLLHDIGAFKTESFEQLIQFENAGFMRHSVYGYLFLKYLSPLQERARPLLYHHFSLEMYAQSDTPVNDIAMLLRLADRIDLAVHLDPQFNLDVFLAQYSKHFLPHHVYLLRSAAAQGAIEAIREKQYKKTIYDVFDAIVFNDAELKAYMEMIAYSIDFQSELTMTHTMTTVAASVVLATHAAFSKEQLHEIYWGSLLHDLGKIAIPISILDKPGKLSDEEMEIMRKHVVYTEEILDGIVHESIVKLAARHHEKLDGSGYPRGLTAKDLSLGEQIIAVADIVSALSGKRSYKEVFDKKTLLDVLQNMKDAGKLNADICMMMAAKYDNIMAEISQRCDQSISSYLRIQKEYSDLQVYFEKVFERQSVS